MRDFKEGKNTPEERNVFSVGRYRWLIGGIALPLIAVAIFLPDNDEPAIEAETEVVAEVKDPGIISKEISLPDTTNSAPDSAPLMPVAKPVSTPTATGAKTNPASGQINDYQSHITLTVRSGDTLDKLFRRNNLSIQDLHRIMSLKLSKQHLRMIRPGDELKVAHQDDHVTSVRREIDLWKNIVISEDGDSYTAEIVENAIDTRLVEASGQIDSILWNAGVDAGLPPGIIMELSGVFSWDIDFALDIRRGDQFVVVYEELWRDGKKEQTGEIIAAEFVNRGKSFQAIRYEDPNGRVNYYSPDGKNMRKAFLRVPLDVFRVSSRFNPNRRHPVLNTIRAHKGVDYAAPRGTPIKATGDGKVTFKGVKGGYGNTIILSHGDNISTLYAHMDKFSRAAKRGGRVKQGNIIGYVGSSGLATGPHLHYEYRKDGVHRNPSTVKLPAGQPINSNYLADFQRTAAPLLERLNNQRQVLASNFGGQ